MEGVPRLNMLSFPLKRSADSPDFRTNLKRFISQHYSEDPQAYSQEISTLESLRASAVHASRDFTGCAILKKYFCQLQYLKSRFPLQEGSSIAVSFSWYDVFSDFVHGWKDIDFEMASILYNIGALHSDLGTKDTRVNADGMKTSCTHFQCAAWAFQHLKNDYYKFSSSDISSDILNIMSNICLAQAQECILEKSLIDNRKSGIIAKISLQIVDYYQLTRKTIDSVLKKSSGHSDNAVKAVKKWRELVQVKIHYYGCVSYLYRGLQSEEQTKFGERITYYKAGMEKLTEAIKLTQSMDKADSAALTETLNFTTDVVGTKLSTSEKENEYIYHEKVPTLESIDIEFKGVSLVKGIPFKFDDPEIAGPDIFARLVPMEAHEASSLYSEEKAKILRSYSTKVEEKDEVLDRFLIAMQLDQLDIHSEEMKIPQALIDCCASLSVNPEAVKKLSSLMSKLSGMFHDVEHNIKEINELLKEEDVKEKEFQEIVGKRPPNNLLTELSREAKKYQHAHTVASESNQTLHEAMKIHVVNLQILMKPLSEVLKHIPSLSDIEETDETAINEMKRLRSKIEEMQKQRESLLNQLRESILKDDITKSLVVKQEQGIENVFEEELKKHDKITQILDQNLLAQDNILRALTETNAAYAETRKATEEVLKKRDKAISALLGSYDAYNELIIKCTQGVEFYTKLDANVSKLLDRARAACKVQEEEREERTNAIMKATTNQNTRDSTLNSDSNVSNPQSSYYYTNTNTNLATSSSAVTTTNPYHLYSAPSPSAGDVDPMYNDPMMTSMMDTNSLLIQQQYEKNLALQKEYEQLQKLQQQIQMAKENSHMAAHHQQQQPQQQPQQQQYHPNNSYHNSVVSSHQSQHHHQQQQQQQYPISSYTSTTTTVPASAHYGTSSVQYYGLGGAPLSSSQPMTTPSPQLQQQQQQQQHYTMEQPASNYQAYPMNNTSTFSSQQHYVPPMSANNHNHTASIITSQQSQQQQQQQQHYNQPYHSMANPSYINSSSPAPTSMTYPTNSSASGIVQGYNNVPSTVTTGALNSPQMYPSSQQQYVMTSIDSSSSPAPAMASPYNMQQHPQQNQQQQYSPNPLLQQYSQQYGIVGQNSFASSASPPPQSGYGNYPAIEQASKQRFEKFLEMQGQATTTTNTYGHQPIISSTSSQYGEDVNQRSNMLYNTTNQAITNPASYNNTNNTTGNWGSVPSSNVSNYPQQPQQQQQPSQNYPAYSYGYTGVNNYYDQTNAQASNYPSVSYPNQQQQQPQQHQPPYENSSVETIYANQQQVYETASNQSHVSDESQQQAVVVKPSPPPPPPSSGAVKSGGELSNIDLLAGVDLNLPHQPLLPQPLSSLPPSGALDSESLSCDKNKQDSSLDLNSVVLPSSSPLTSSPAHQAQVPLNSLNSPAKSLSSSKNEGDATAQDSEETCQSQVVSALNINSLPLTLKNENRAKPAVVDHLADPNVLEKFTYDVENLEHAVEGFYKKSLNGPTNLDLKWKEVIDIQNAASIKMSISSISQEYYYGLGGKGRSISVARCYPMKNRYPDILPFDQTRVPLPSTKDDYINASFVKGISATAIPYIATQAPLPVTYSDFWSMVWEHHVELIVCLASDIDLKEHTYWPLERGKDLAFGPLNISLQSKNVKTTLVERIFCITHRDVKQTRVAIHLQFTGWTGNVFPDSPGPLLSFIGEVHNFFLQQRSLSRPVVAHCVAGVGKTGIFITLSAAVREIQNGRSFPDLTSIAGMASEQRKGILNDKEYLRFAYQSLLYYCQDLLMKRGILSARATFDEKPKATHHRHPSQDFLTEAIKKMVHQNTNSTANGNSGQDSAESTIATTTVKNNSLPTTPSHRSNQDTDTDTVHSPRGRIFSDVPASLMDVDVSTFKTNLKESDGKRIDQFESRKGALTKKFEISADPLSSLDPLWTMKK